MVGDLIWFALLLYITAHYIDGDLCQKNAERLRRGRPEFKAWQREYKRED
jgi:hypothetical protein